MYFKVLGLFVYLRVVLKSFVVRGLAFFIHSKGRMKNSLENPDVEINRKKFPTKVYLNAQRLLVVRSNSVLLILEIILIFKI